MDAQHTHTLTTDYVLGLLPPDERRRVESHARRCEACRLALKREQALGALVRGAITEAARPAPGRLAAIRPPLPAPKTTAAPLYRRLAPLSLVAAMLVMALLFGAGRFDFSPALYAASDTPTYTATYTHTPTATLAEVEAVGPLGTVRPDGLASGISEEFAGVTPALPVAATPVIQTAAP